MKNKQIAFVVIGILLALASLWIGSYVLLNPETPTWANFPTYVTGCFGFALGIIIAVNYWPTES